MIHHTLENFKDSSFEVGSIINLIELLFYESNDSLVKNNLVSALNLKNINGDTPLILIAKSTKMGEAVSNSPIRKTKHSNMRALIALGADLSIKNRN